VILAKEVWIQVNVNDEKRESKEVPKEGDEIYLVVSLTLAGVGGGNKLIPGGTYLKKRLVKSMTNML
jgi:hypothetical protein